MVCMPTRISRKMMAVLSGRKILSLIRRQRQKMMRSILQEQEMMELRPGFLPWKVLYQRDQGLAGYVVDQEKHEVELNWDTTAGNVNDMGDSDKVPDKEDPFGNDGNDPSSGVYVWKKEKN